MSDDAWQADCLSYVGRTVRMDEDISPARSNALLATFDDQRRLDDGDVLPSLFHWLHFNPAPELQAMKQDGHEKLGRFLPPVKYPRRMWAGSKIAFYRPIRLGASARRVSSVKSVTFKSGASGPLCFVDVEHVISQNAEICISDTHTIVYREPPLASTPDLVPGNANAIGPVVMFRYSALTFNSHRIHYDADYCREVEGYPGLVVHGPLMATILMRAAEKKAGKDSPKYFSFRGKAPLFAGEGFDVSSRITDSADSTMALDLVKTDGTTSVSAEIQWS